MRPDEVMRSELVATIYRQDMRRHSQRAFVEAECRPAVSQLPPVDHTINERAACRAAIDRATENGMVAEVRAGMDCDCVQYQSVRIVPAPVSVVAWLRDYYEGQAWLDGPESTHFAPPSWYPEGDAYESRDLALQAFEDGHPHCVHPVAL